MVRVNENGQYIFTLPFSYHLNIEHACVSTVTFPFFVQITRVSFNYLRSFISFAYLEHFWDEEWKNKQNQFKIVKNHKRCSKTKLKIFPKCFSYATKQLTISEWENVRTKLKLLKLQNVGATNIISWSNLRNFWCYHRYQLDVRSEKISFWYSVLSKEMKIIIKALFDLISFVLFVDDYTASHFFPRTL